MQAFSATYITLPHLLLPKNSVIAVCHKCHARYSFTFIPPNPLAPPHSRLTPILLIMPIAQSAFSAPRCYATLKGGAYHVSYPSCLLPSACFSHLAVTLLEGLCLAADMQTVIIVDVNPQWRHMPARHTRLGRNGHCRSMLSLGHFVHRRRVCRGRG